MKIPYLDQGYMSSRPEKRYKKGERIAIRNPMHWEYDSTLHLPCARVMRIDKKTSIDSFTYGYRVKRVKFRLSNYRWELLNPYIKTIIILTGCITAIGSLVYFGIEIYKNYPYIFSLLIILGVLVVLVIFTKWALYADD